MIHPKPTDLPEPNESFQENFLDEPLSEMDAEAEEGGDPGAPPPPPH